MNVNYSGLFNGGRPWPAPRAVARGELVRQMPRLTSIYTKSGDSGRTQLSDGTRVPKDSPRTELLGELDELNAALGVAAASGLPTELVQPVSRVQNELFNLGAELSFGRPPEQPSVVPLVRDQDVLRLEEAIDRNASRLGPLRNFILPGGSAAGAHLHLARTVCRRTERRLVALSGESPVRETCLCYLNRLSDALFMWARLANQAQHQPEILWDPAKY